MIMHATEPDILVVGAGSTGAAAAAMLAAQGRAVAMVDWRRPTDAGARWANGVPGWMFDAADLPRPEPPERLRPGATHNAVLCDPEGRAAVQVPADPLVHIDMRRLTARLQAQAQEAGAVLTQERVVAVERRGARVHRVTLATGRKERTVQPRLTVDASGRAAAIRRRVPLLADLGRPPSPRDLCIAAQYQYRVRDVTEATAFLARHGAQAGDAVSFLGVAGGYSVLMVGLSEDLSEVAVLAGSIPAMGVPSGPTVLDRYVRARPWIGERIFGGQGEIPLGPPWVRLTAPGVALLGDAAHTVFAVHGSGVGMGLIAARRLADALHGVDDPGDPVALHRYGCGFQRTYGGRLAAADLFRRFTQGLTRSDITALMASGLMNSRMMSTGLMQAPFAANGLSPGLIANGLVRAPRSLFRMAPVGLRMMALQKHYDRYPDAPDARGIARFARRARQIRGE